MKTIQIVTIEAARARAKLLQVKACNLSAELTLCAYDVITDLYPESDVRMLGNSKSACARGEFEFTIQ